MKKTIVQLSFTLIASVFLLMQSCVEADGLATPNVASPVLVLLQGSTFPSTARVEVTSTVLELDKANILDHTKGIDSIPVSNLVLRVFINAATEVGTVTTGPDGKASLSVSWADLGLTVASSGRQVRLEFAGMHKNISFRKYHTVRVQ